MWWERPGLEMREGRLAIAGRDAESLAREHGTPLYVFDLQRIGEQARSLQNAFDRLGAPFRLRYALKANREPEVLAFVRSLGGPGEAGAVGMDVCSPGEVRHALAHGWLPEEISYTGTNVSERDLDVLLETGVHVNLDLLSQLRRYGRRAPGSTVGIRVNPRAGAKWSEDSKSLYSSEKPTKFGIYAEQLPEALAIAHEHYLVIDTVHFHVGDGFLTSGLPQFEVAVERASDMARWLLEEGCPIGEVNAGGGLGVPQEPQDEALDVDAYAAVLNRHLGPLGVTIACEPGDFHGKQAGVLLVEVVTVEDRLGVTFAGTDAGFNAGPEHFIYASPQPIVLARAAGDPPARDYTISGHINEGPDLWGEGVALPEVAEGDILAILNIGTYNQSMQMLHCLRPGAPARYLAERI
jgi:diaminopimelate decarboxylase